MFFVIEGSDKSGKTTLAKMLSEKYNLPIQHTGKPKTNDFVQEQLDIIANVKGPVIFDRSFLSEYVYAELWRGGCKITDEQFRMLEQKMYEKSVELGLDFVLVYAYAPAAIIKQRCIDEKEDLLQINQVDKCLELYEELFEKTSLSHIAYDSSVDSTEKIVSILHTLVG